jgi:hypothetical protein
MGLAPIEISKTSQYLKNLLNVYPKSKNILRCKFEGDLCVLDNGLFFNLDNESLNKYKKILKIEKNYNCFLLLLD